MQDRAIFLVTEAVPSASHDNLECTLGLQQDLGLSLQALLHLLPVEFWSLEEWLLVL